MPTSNERKMLSSNEALKELIDEKPWSDVERRKWMWSYVASRKTESMNIQAKLGQENLLRIVRWHNAPNIRILSLVGLRPNTPPLGHEDSPQYWIFGEETFLTLKPERTNPRALTFQAGSAEDTRIYESIVIEFFFRLKIHNIGTCVWRFYLENLVFIVSMVNISHAVSCWNIYIVRDPANVKITVDS